jgi:glyoxylase-like metal-dependent hydrolase (beta-lactamase superfamily II)
VTADFTRVLAPNPSALTLNGTNTWVVGRDPAWVIDPGPAIDSHLSAVAEEVTARGGAGGIALTHDHADHSEAIEPLRARIGEVPVARFGDVGETPFDVFFVPGHADDHLVFVRDRAAFTGDAVLGQGSVFVSGRLREYLEGLRMLRALPLEIILPGHGDPVSDPAAKLDEYLAHRAERERKLLAAWDGGARSEDELLDIAWSDAPANVRQFAAISMRTHLEKLREEGRVPVE